MIVDAKMPIAPIIGPTLFNAFEMVGPIKSRPLGPNLALFPVLVHTIFSISGGALFLAGPRRSLRGGGLCGAAGGPSWRYGGVLSVFGGGVDLGRVLGCCGDVSD